jgi:hypothetical protein
LSEGVGEHGWVLLMLEAGELLTPVGDLLRDSVRLLTMSSTVAIVAITSGATLSAAAITAFAGQAQARRRDASEVEQMLARFRHERSLHDVDELRAVLDDAAETIREVRGVVTKPTGPEWLEEGLARLKPVQSKLGLRLGAKHPLTWSASTVVEALEDIEGLYASVKLRTEKDEDEFWASFEMMREEVGYCADRFLEDAQETVGARLLVEDEGD